MAGEIFVEAVKVVSSRPGQECGRPLGGEPQGFYTKGTKPDTLS